MQVNKENENEIPDEKWSKKDGSQHCQTAGSPNKMKVEIPLWTPVLGEFLYISSILWMEEPGVGHD